MTGWLSRLLRVVAPRPVKPFDGDDHTDWLRAEADAARDQRKASIREVDRLASNRSTGNPLGDLLADRRDR